MRDRLVGKTLGDFHIESQLGSGAMGKVYRAMQVSLRRPVALKVLEEGVFTPDEFKIRFRREAEYIARLEHPHIVSVYQYGNEEPYTYYAMRLIEGKSLEHHMAEGLTMTAGLRWLADIAGALAYAHGQQVIHRDVKPGNVMIANDIAYLADFGLARLLESTTITASGTLMGTLLYMAPEQVRRERATEASDVYAMGVILYELTTTVHPFVTSPDADVKRMSGSGRMETMDRISRGKFPPPTEILPTVPSDLEEIILRAMAVEPGNRHANARELQKDLRRACGLAGLAPLDAERSKRIGRPLAPPSSAVPPGEPEGAANGSQPGMPAEAARAPAPGAAQDAGFDATAAAAAAASLGLPGAAEVVPAAVAAMVAPDAAPRASEGPPGGTAALGAAPRVPPTALDPARMQGERIGRYHLLEEIGRSAKTVVYKGVQEDLNKLVAVKVLPAWTGNDADRLLRFRLEASTAAALRHPNLLSIHQADEAGGKIYCAMDLVEGEPLDRVMRRERIPPRRALEIARDVARALAAAHAQGITHRDLRPGNVFVDGSGRVRVSDLGLAHALREERRPLAGSDEPVAYAAFRAPEQARGDGSRGDPRTDVYGLGALLYFLLTGRPPFDGADVARVGEQIETRAPLAPRRLEPRLHPDAEAICLHALDKDPAHRYPTAEAMAEDLDALLSAQALRLSREPGWNEVAAVVRARPALPAALAVGTLALAVLALRGAFPAADPGAAHLRRAEAFFQADDPGRAAVEAERAVALSPAPGRAWYRLGRIELRRWLDAEAPPAARLEAGEVRLAEATTAGHEARDRCRAAFEGALAAGGLDEGERAIAEAALLRTGGRESEAALAFGRAAQRHAPERDLWLAAARAHYRAGEFGAALDAAQVGLERRKADPALAEIEVRALLALGWKSAAEGRDARPIHRQALAACVRQRAVDPADPRWPALEEVCRLLVERDK